MSITNLFKGVKETKSKRLGRGIGSGRGKTAGRGTKGQKSRSGAGRKIKPWFEGGQTPLFRKLAKKRGFNHHRPERITLTTNYINLHFKDGETVSVDSLLEKKLIRPSQGKADIKVVSRQPLNPKIKIEGIKVSKSLQK
jgi:large subunit ribosomal protein L15